MQLTLRRGDAPLELPDEPMFFESFNYREVIGIYPVHALEANEEDHFVIYCAEAQHIYCSNLTLKQMRDAINGDAGLFGTVQKRAFYILIHNSGYGSRISPEDFRNHYCARVSLVTPPHVYVNCKDFDGVPLEKEIN